MTYRWKLRKLKFLLEVFSFAGTTAEDEISTLFLFLGNKILRAKLVKNYQLFIEWVRPFDVLEICMSSLVSSQYS